MDKSQAASMGLSVIALVVSVATAFFQYQTRQDAVNESLKVELKMTLEDTLLNPTELRMLSGVEDRAGLKAAVVVTNIGLVGVRILEVGYHNWDLPDLVFHAHGEKAKLLSPGEQVIFPAPDVYEVKGQLTDDIKVGEGRVATVFAVSTKGKRFEAPAIIEVAK